MPRLYRPTGMRKYRPFGGPGGKLLSASGGGGGASFSDDFDSYTNTDLFSTASGIWQQARSQSTWTVSGTTDKIVTGVISSDGLDGALYLPASNGYVDGTISCTAQISVGGHANSQPGLLGRWVDVDNFVYCRLNNGSNNLGVVSRSSGVQTETTASQVWTRGQNYFVDLILSGTDLTCNVYSDSDKTTLVKSVSHTSNHTASGYMGMQENAQSTGRGIFNDWSFTV